MKQKTIEKVLAYIKTQGYAPCVHTVAKALNLTMGQASGCLTLLKQQGKITVLPIKACCEYQGEKNRVAHCRYKAMGDTSTKEPDITMQAKEEIIRLTRENEELEATNAELNAELNNLKGIESELNDVKHVLSITKSMLSEARMREKQNETKIECLEKRKDTVPEDVFNKFEAHNEKLAITIRKMADVISTLSERD